MTCFYHSEKESSAQCMDCGKSLCSKCASKDVPCLCPDCAKMSNKVSILGEVLHVFLKSALFFVISVALFCFLNKLGISKIWVSLIVGSFFTGILYRVRSYVDELHEFIDIMRKH